MSTTSNISARGQIQNTLHMGFTDQDALHELLDNSRDAGATHIRIRLISSPPTLCVDDDARGMTAETLASAVCFHNTRDASAEIGLRGFGAKAGPIVLSDAASMTRIFTRTLTTDVVETCLNWPQAIKDNLYNPQVTDLTILRSNEWQQGALNPAHGTVTVIPMTPAHYESLSSKLPGILDEMGRTYEDFIRTGLTISVVVDGRPYAPDLTLGLNWDDTPQHMRNEVAVEVLRHPETREDRVYYRHVHGRPIWEEMVRNDPASPKRMLRDYQAAKDAGFVCIASTKLRSTYQTQWNPTLTGAVGSRLPYIPGYMSLCRGGRHLRAVPTEFPSSGDYEKRRVIASVRHALYFTFDADALFDMSINKSLVIVDHIHPELLKTIQKLTKDWSGQLYERHLRPGRVVGPENLTKRNLKLAVRMLKSIAAGEEGDWYESFCEWASDQVDGVTIDDDSTTIASID